MGGSPGAAPSYQRFVEALCHTWAVVGPVTATDGVCRLQEVTGREDHPCARLPLLPLKQLFLPASELLWSWQAEEYQLPPLSTPSAGIALLDVAPCDLYALAYLDQIYSDDPYYQARRQSTLLIGAECSPTSHCFCPPHSDPPPFDLFFAGGCLWSGSALGDQVLQDFAGEGEGRGDGSLPRKYWAGQIAPLPADLPARFLQSAAHPLWAEVAGHCLSCGACSAVCPTCSCYDVIDEVSLSGEISRRRVWDNCFFRNHGLVAGGENFRADRTARLRFRFEHKYLGFGAQRGVSSCVGCGRCQQVCPARISFAQILEKLPALEER